MSEDTFTPFEGKSGQSNRLIHIGLLFGLASAVLWGALTWHQIFLRQHYLEKEAYQTYRRVVKEGARGSIFDRNGVLLAGNQPRFSVGVYLNELRGEFRERYRDLKEKKKVLGDEFAPGASLSWMARKQVLQSKMDEVSEIIGRELVLDGKDFESHFLRRLILPYEVCNDLTRDEYSKLVEMLPPESPLQIFTEAIRYYPFGSAASHVIGYVSQGKAEDIEVNFGDHEDVRTLNLKRHQGKTGLEKSLDAQLRGGIGWELWSIDPLGFQFDKVDSLEPEQGSDLHTTLDIDIQLVGEAAMAGNTGAIAAVTVETGEVLALVSEPKFDLNKFVPFLRSKDLTELNENEKKPWLSRTIQGVYPPGSTFKVVTALTGLNDRGFSPMQEIYCGRYFRVGDRNFPENRSRGHGYINMVDSLAYSSNVYFYQLGLRVGINNISEQAKLLGLGEKTGIELPFESSSTLVPTREWKKEAGRGVWLKGDTANVSIGQGDLKVTPLQMARLTAAVAQKREYLPVTLLKGKNTSLYTPGKLKIDSNRFDYIIEGMRRCVIKGTGKSMKLDYVDIAAKTGTAQVFPGGKEENLAWVIAFAPVKDPKIAVAVVVEDIQSRDPIYGGSTAGPIARDVIDEYFKKYGME